MSRGNYRPSSVGVWGESWIPSLKQASDTYEDLKASVKRHAEHQLQQAKQKLAATAQPATPSATTPPSTPASAPANAAPSDKPADDSSGSSLKTVALIGAGAVAIVLVIAAVRR